MSRGSQIALVALVGFLLVESPAARADDSEAALAGCPGYMDHLRNARAYLARSDRSNALAELKRARESLQACEQAEAGETELAARARSALAS